MGDPSEVVRNHSLLVAFTAPNPEDVHFIGVAIGYYAQPTYIIDRGGDHAASWAASLTREATPEEAIAYWRERALKAEEGVGDERGG